MTRSAPSRVISALTTEGEDNAPRIEPQLAARLSAPIRASSLGQNKARERDWILQGLVPRRVTTGLPADGGMGKTQLALHMAVCITLGRPWLGFTTLSGSVVFFSAEDDLDELHRRLEKICAYEGVEVSDLDRLIIVPHAGQDALLGTTDRDTGGMKPTALWDDLRKLLGSVHPVLLVLDTLADVFGGNEIDRAQARSFVGMLTGAAIEFDLAVLVLSHPSLQGMITGRGSSGSTAWSNSMRSRLYLEKPKKEKDEPQDENARILTVKKSNYGPVGLTIPLRWIDGVFVRDEGEAAAAREVEEDARSSVADQVFMSLLAMVSSQGRTVSPSPSSSYAPAVFAKHPASEGFKKKSFEAAMERLLQAGAIHVAEDGPPSKKRKHIHVGAGPSNALPT